MTNVSATNEEKHELPKDFLGEMSALWVLGLPMGLTQLVQFSIQTIDVVMIGRLGADALGAASLGMAVFFVVFLTGFGPAMAISPLVSQALGANQNDYDDVRLTVRMGLWSVVIGTPFILGLFFLAKNVLLLLGQPQHLVDLAAPYIIALAPGLPFAIAVMMLRNFLAAIDRTIAPLIIIIFTTLINACLNFLLIYGNFSFPELGLVGAGIASSIAHFLGFAFLVFYIYWDKVAARFSLFRDFFNKDWTRLKELIRLGWPIGVATSFEGMLFNAGVLLMGRIGAAEVAAYQIALNVAALAFMMPLGMSMAGAVRVGLAVGARNLKAVQRSAFASVLLSVGFILLFAVPVVAAPDLIIGGYLDTNDSGNKAVAALAATFLPIAGAFMVFDAVQVAANQALRGLKDVDIPMVLTGVSYWVVGFPLAAGLGLYSSAGARGVWWGLLAALGCAAFLLGTRLWQLTRQLPKQPIHEGSH